MIRGGYVEHIILNILVDSRINICAKWCFTLAAGWQVLQSSVLIQFSTMFDEPTTRCHVDAVRILTGMLPMLDSANPNDRVLKHFFTSKTQFSTPKLTLSCHDMMQCIVYNTPVPAALECSDSTMARQGMYKRIARWRSSLAPANLAILQSIEVARGIMPQEVARGNIPRCSAPAESPSLLSSSATASSTRVNS